MKKSYVSLFLSLVVALVVAGCGGGQGQDPQAGGEANAGNAGAGQVEKLKVGIMSGPEEDIWKVVKEVAAKDSLDLELVVFSDYVQPNKVLEDGQLDANAFQHVPYLEEFNAGQGTHIVKLADTINYPIGMYSKKVKDVAELKEGDLVGLPNDPTNGARALILFEQAGLIKLKEGVGVKATIRDIVDNPKKLEFKEMDAAFLTKALDDLAAAVINSNFAIESGLVPTKDAIFMEPKDSPWVNIIAVREADKDKPVFQKLVKAFHSDEVKKLVTEKYGDSMVTAW
ncbi:MetQ/NlpA family ABC transporter substrate-binding protein [Brevibacillus nitrificans]|uniref:Lipoprotein n=1 Tax=Brevibacillus nitrificans TaxID=651560 RepID=A0A3M8CR28_9BACL|nr:MetQ/NlpA family ABC transporter substrate-binding protein [Brevibacillus nitrificans]RNB78133.1 MetQ/NlpA family ABC transporter substrate-binding protein [Brevibacillus nitrificans]